MKKSKFIISAFLLFIAVAANGFGAGAEKQEYYQMKIYRIC